MKSIDIFSGTLFYRDEFTVVLGMHNRLDFTVGGPEVYDIAEIINVSQSFHCWGALQVQAISCMPLLMSNESVKSHF